MADAADSTMCSPAKLIEMIRAGDVDALDRMTRCYGDRLMAMGVKYCSTEDEAKDAVQDALLSVGTHMTDFRGDGSLEGWLVRIVANACRRMQRGMKNDPSRHVELSPDHGDESESPEARAARGQLADALGDALHGLQPRDRVILLLSDGSGWTAPELAKKLDMTPNAVRTRLSRIRRQLRGVLTSHWEDWRSSQAG